MAKLKYKNKMTTKMAWYCGIPLEIISIFWLFSAPCFTALLCTIFFGGCLWVLWGVKKREDYYKKFFNRKTRLEEINANNFIDTALTKQIETALSTKKSISIGRDTKSFQNLKILYDNMFQSERRDFYGPSMRNDAGPSLSGTRGIVPKCNPIILRYVGTYETGYALYCFPEAILAFAEGPDISLFIAAYSPEVLQLSYSDEIYSFEKVIEERTQYNIRYYDKFRPVKDADLIASGWRYTNKDGSRSFRGGMLPKNNPITYKFRYGKVNVRFGNYTSASVFSNCQSVKAFLNEYNGVPGNRINRSSNLSNRQVVNDSNDEYDLYDDKPKGRSREQILKDWQSNSNNSSKITDKEEKIKEQPKEQAVIQKNERDDRINAVFPASSAGRLRSEIEIEADDDYSIPSTSVPSNQNNVDSVDDTITNNNAGKIELTEEQARNRNRNIAKSAVDALNQKYQPKYDFKVYQVRKAREGWGVQDAGVYTYVKDLQGNQYTIEFDLITNLSVPRTDLRFSIWGKSKELVSLRYRTTVSKGMQISGDGYGLLLQRNYEKTNTNTMEAAFVKDCLTLMKLIDIDDPL